MAESTSLGLARRIVEHSLSKKAQDVCLMDLQGLGSVTDYFIVCHGESDVQVKAIANAIIEGMEEEGVRVWHKEGYEYLNWVLLDYVDVVVHIFQKEIRRFYGLERLWGDATLETFQDEA
ncbi:MAG: ribosome silencing factor [bacterium]